MGRPRKERADLSTAVTKLHSQGLWRATPERDQHYPAVLLVNHDPRVRGAVFEAMLDHIQEAKLQESMEGSDGELIPAAGCEEEEQDVDAIDEYDDDSEDGGESRVARNRLETECGQQALADFDAYRANGFIPAPGISVIERHKDGLRWSILLRVNDLSGIPEACIATTPPAVAVRPTKTKSPNEPPRAIKRTFRSGVICQFLDVPSSNGDVVLGRINAISASLRALSAVLAESGFPYDLSYSDVPYLNDFVTAIQKRQSGSPDNNPHREQSVDAKPYHEALDKAARRLDRGVFVSHGSVQQIALALGLPLHQLVFEHELAYTATAWKSRVESSKRLKRALAAKNYRSSLANSLLDPACSDPKKSAS